MVGTHQCYQYLRSGGIPPIQLWHNRDLLAASLTTNPNQSLFTMGSSRAQTVVTIPMLVKAHKIMLNALQFDTTLYSLHGLRRGGNTSAYQAGIDQIDIKCYGL